VKVKTKMFATPTTYLLLAWILPALETSMGAQTFAERSRASAARDDGSATAGPSLEDLQATMDTACPTQALEDIPKIEKAKLYDLQSEIDKASTSMGSIATTIPQSREAEEKMKKENSDLQKDRRRARDELDSLAERKEKLEDARGDRDPGDEDKALDDLIKLKKEELENFDKAIETLKEAMEDTKDRTAALGRLLENRKAYIRMMGASKANWRQYFLALTARVNLTLALPPCTDLVGGRIPDRPPQLPVSRGEQR